MKFLTAVSAIAALSAAATAAGGSIDTLLAMSAEEKEQFFRRGLATAADPIPALLAKCGIEATAGQKPEEAIAAALEAAAASGSAESATLRTALEQAGIKIEAGAKPEAIKAAVEKAIASKAAGKIAAAGLKELMADTPPAASGDAKPPSAQLTGLARATAAHAAALQAGK